MSGTVHPFRAPDPVVVSLGEAEADRCDECGEVEDHRNHHVPDPSLHTFNPPAWLIAAIDQRIAQLDSALGPAAASYPIILSPLTEPEEGADDVTFQRWERACDNCGTHCPAGTDFYTGTAGRTLHGTQVVITYGACAKCAGRLGYCPACQTPGHDTCGMVEDCPCCEQTRRAEEGD